MSIGSEYWRKEVEGLKSQLLEKTEELDTLKRHYNFIQETLTQLGDKLEKCSVSDEVVVKLKGSYHTFFKKKISHPDYTEDNQKDITQIIRAPLKYETSDGKELDPKGKVQGYIYYCEDPDTGKKVVVKNVSEYDALEIKYNAVQEANDRLRCYATQLESEKEMLHREVNDFAHKLSQIRRERDELAKKWQKLKEIS